MPEQRVLKQLVEALLFEGLVPTSVRATGGVEAALEFRLKRRNYQCIGKRGAFGRVRIRVDSLRSLGGGFGADAPSWSEIVEQLPAADCVLAQLGEELANTVRFCQANSEAAGRHEPRRLQDYETLEGSLDEGHLYHPCFKSRQGFSLEDHRRFGPEARQSFGVRLLAVARPCLRQALPEDESEFWRTELDPETLRDVELARRAENAPAEAYGLVPVHPWQWERLKLRPALLRALQRAELIDLRVSTRQYRASQSLRTLLPLGAPQRPHVKLSMAVRISSSERILHPETVQAAPRLSRWLCEVVEDDPFLDPSRLIVLREFAGACYAPAEDEPALEGQIGAIWRDNVLARLTTGESAAPLNAILVRERDGLPFVDAWLARYGLRAWLERLLKVLLLPLWRLLVHHGLALEAHAQNVVLIHREGWPVRIAIRDFHESLEYCADFLRAPSAAPNWNDVDERFERAPPDRYYAMSSVEELRELFMDSLFVYALSEFSDLLERHYAFPEDRFWAMVDGVLHGYARSTSHDAAREARLGHRAPRIRTESLFRARLEGPRPDGHHHWIPNPLRADVERHDHARYR